MSRQRHQPFDQSELFPKRNEFDSVSHNQAPQLQPGNRYSYNYTSQSSTSTRTRGSRGNSIEQFSDVQQEVRYNASPSISTSTVNIVTRERQIEVEIQPPRHRQREIYHFSHRHPLQKRELLNENVINMCKVCLMEIYGPAYGCMECNYFLHKSCFDMPLEINHKAHMDHPLTLFSSSAACEDGEFFCDACDRLDSGFHYSCSACPYELHVVCSSLPKTVKHPSHGYTLTLFYSFPFINEAATVFCDICHGDVSKDSWVYYDRDSDFISHVYCAFCEEDEEDGEDAIGAIQNRLIGLGL